MRAVAALLGLGTAALVAALILAWSESAGFMPTYLASWMVAAGLPLGALVLLLLLEAGGRPSLDLAPALRGLALLMPLLALAFIPVLIWMHPLYAWIAGAGTGAPFGEVWLGHGWFIFRAAIYLLLLSGLALLFVSPWRAGGRRGLALLALFAVALIGTLASLDWIESLDTGLHSGEFGLLIIGMACASASAGIVLLCAFSGVAPARAARWLLAGASAAWLYLHFMQFLVAWSGDLPKEAAWYLARDAGAGRAIEWTGFVAGFLLPMLLLLPLAWPALVMAVIAGLALAAHALEGLWFVVPVSRHATALRWQDGLLLLGFLGLALGLALLGTTRLRRGTDRLA